MNIAFSGIAAAGCVASALFLSRPASPDLDGAASAAPIIMASAETDRDMFQLAGPGGRSACRLSRFPTAGVEQAAVETSPDCDRLLPGLSRAVMWREQPDGSVRLDDASGKALARFAQADGSGYESYQPSRPLLSLIPLD